MPKIKIPRNSPSIDMTPMVDLAFLLVTFFMLTTKFRPEEAVQVTIPFSVSQTKLPDNVTTISIDSVGRVFYDMDGKDARGNLLKYMQEKYKAVFPDITADDVARFSILGPFGESMSDMKKYIEGTEEDRKVMNHATPGIPMDTVKDNELADWVNMGLSASLADYNAKKSAGQTVNPPRFAIKADSRAKYKVIKQVIDICQKNGVQHFNLITSIKSKQ
jgi:biopolymer transport protein ExbD